MNQNIENEHEKPSRTARASRNSRVGCLSDPVPVTLLERVKQRARDAMFNENSARRSVTRPLSFTKPLRVMLPLMHSRGSRLTSLSSRCF